MVKPYFTRKNLIIIALTFFYSLVLVLTGICIDASYTIVKKKNLINLIGLNLGFQEIEAGIAGFVTVLLLSIYILVFVAAFLYERRYAIMNSKKIFSLKMIITYSITLVLCLLLSLGVGLILQASLDSNNIGLLFKYVSQTVVLGTLLYAVAFGFVGFTAMLVINFIFVDKPFRFWSKKETVSIEEPETDVDVTSSFDESPEALTAAGVAGGVAGGVGGGSGPADISNVKQVEELDDREKVFPALSKMDVEYNGYSIDRFESDDLSLKDLCDRFRNYLADKEGLYYDEDTIRFFISGLGTSHFMILEGLSGTGKSSLPRYFAKFCGANLLFIPVQTTWRDRSSMLGYFNDFSKTYSETDFLLNLYHANYNPDQLHLFVLDEMNISRVEYYFADLLSVLEYPEDEWKLRLMQLPYGFIPPAKLDDGFVKIPNNSFFIGTANKDDSTFVITDKVYDRAITIDFDYRNAAFKATGNSEPIKLSNSKLQFLYETASMIPEAQMNNADYEKLETITSFIYEQFDLTFGNRIQTQIDTIVPIFIACGGTKESVLDFLLERKIIAKLEGRFEEYVKTSLKQLLQLLAKTYGQGVLARSEKAINKLIRRL